MSILNLSWFKSRKQKELEELQIKEVKLRVELLEKEKTLVEHLKETSTPTTKPYLRRKMVGDTLTVVMDNGDVLTKLEATKEDYEKVGNAQTEEEVTILMASIEKRKEFEKIVEEKKQIQDTISKLEVLKNHPDFAFNEDSIYLRGNKRSIPTLLVNKFAAILSEPVIDSSEYESLKKFWLKCCLNPNAQSAEDLYTFLTYHQFKIDKHGNFYAYRRVVSKQNDNSGLVTFVSNTYTKVKAVWKKNPALYNVYLSDGEYAFSKDKHEGDLGNLKDLYLDLPNMQEKNYTSKHTGQEDYKVGEVVSMPRNEGDDNNHISCSRGFHAASKKYDYTGFGDTPILVIINPMDVLSVPLGEVGKLRTCRWFFASVLANEEQHILDDEDFDVTELGDVFEEKCMADLENYVKNGIVEEVKRHTFTIPSITATEIKSIIYSLEDMRNSISNRVVAVSDEQEEPSEPLEYNDNAWGENEDEDW